MNVLFLGNGFDLFHKLPTKYSNFLNTIDCLSSLDISKITMVGDVFANTDLNYRDKEIHASYKEYREIYDKTSIDLTSLKQLKTLPNNLWYKYLSKALKGDSSWIDFEKEIFSVTQSFQKTFEFTVNEKLKFLKLDQGEKYIVEKFNFFLYPPNTNGLSSGYRCIKTEYLIEYPLGSKNKILNKPKIIQELSQQLSSLADGLKIYLKCFIENTVKNISCTLALQWQQAFKHTDHVITFNYTNTYEQFYKKVNVMHIHGNIDHHIVLGINPDGADNIETVDTTFIPFKKYFQRIKYKTDLSYLDFMAKNKGTKDIALYIIGHSLDMTDKDVIQETFSLARKIYILNYDETDESNHISNLINIFGKAEFDKMRREKDITFMSMIDDLRNIMRENSEDEKYRQIKEHISLLL